MVITVREKLLLSSISPNWLHLGIIWGLLKKNVAAWVPPWGAAWAWGREEVGTVIWDEKQPFTPRWHLRSTSSTLCFQNTHKGHVLKGPT